MSGKKPQKPKHTDKQAMFIKEYIVDLNGTQAAIRAGYSENTARQEASRLLSNVNVRASINEEMEKRKERVECSQDEVIHNILAVLKADIKDFLGDDGNIDLSKINDYNSPVIKEITTDTTKTDKGDLHTEKKRVFLKLHDKLKAADMLGKHLKMFTDKIEVSGKDGGPIETITTEMTEEKAAEIYRNMVNAPKD
jgi:phage terminase small subunit